MVQPDTHTHLYEAPKVVKLLEMESRRMVVRAGGGAVGSCLMGTVSGSQGKESSGDWLHNSGHVLQLNGTLKAV